MASRPANPRTPPRFALLAIVFAGVLVVAAGVLLALALRETPDVLKSYVQSFDAPIVALTGSPEAVAQAAKAYRVFYAKHPRADGDYDMDHSAVIYVMNPEGRFTATFTPDSSADAIVQRLQKLIS